MSFTAKPLLGCVIGISVSETEEMEDLGFKKDEVNRCSVRLSEALLSAGARLVFGHDWRPGGVMEAITDLAIRHSKTKVAFGETPVSPPITNLVAAPDTPFLSLPDAISGGDNKYAAMLRGIIEARQVSASDSNDRITSLSLMRNELASLCHIRICVGGRLKGFSGKMPGVVEEALYTARRKKPVFASAVFGGASAILSSSLKDELRHEGLTKGLSAEIDEIRKNQFGFISDASESLTHASSVESCVELALHCAVIQWKKWLL